jgi:endonuclease YncB( thermonuclease family)
MTWKAPKPTVPAVFTRSTASPASLPYQPAAKKALDFVRDTYRRGADSPRPLTLVPLRQPACEHPSPTVGIPPPVRAIVRLLVDAWVARDGTQKLVVSLHCLVSYPQPPRHPGTGEPLTGKVVSVADGHTVTILVDRTQRKIRLDAIDCPERRQPFGTRALQFTGEAVFGKQVTVRVEDRDRYGRYVGRVIYQGKDEEGRPVSLDPSAELVRAGFAWWYQKYAPNDKRLAKLETEARKAKRGLWSDPNPVPP